MSDEIEWVCRECGSDQIAAWYPVYERQGIVIQTDDEDKPFAFEYDGITKTGDAGADELFQCLGCDEEHEELSDLVIPRTEYARLKAGLPTTPGHIQQPI